MGPPLHSCSEHLSSCQDILVPEGWAMAWAPGLLPEWPWGSAARRRSSPPESPSKVPNPMKDSSEWQPGVCVDSPDPPSGGAMAPSVSSQHPGRRGRLLLPRAVPSDEPTVRGLFPLCPFISYKAFLGPACGAWIFTCYRHSLKEKNPCVILADVPSFSLAASVGVTELCVHDSYLSGPRSFCLPPAPISVCRAACLCYQIHWESGILQGTISPDLSFSLQRLATSLRASDAVSCRSCVWSSTRGRDVAGGSARSPCRHAPCPRRWWRHSLRSSARALLALLFSDGWTVAESLAISMSIVFTHRTDYSRCVKGRTAVPGSQGQFRSYLKLG